METAVFPELKGKLEEHVAQKLGRRVRGLRIELEPHAVILRGEAISYYVKQLAQHGVREILPNAPLENSIVVGATVEPLGARVVA